MKISSLFPGGNGKGIRAIAALLDREKWHSALQHVNRPGSGQLLPDGFTGRVEQENDAAVCLMKGETLLACGHGAQAKRFLRAAPRLSTTRRQLGEITLRAASQDTDFMAAVSQADQARDSRQWAEGERRYADGLVLYPAHSGYMVQHAHCLKEQKKFAEAEIDYRSALALGAAADEVCEHLDFAAAQQGHRELPGGYPITALQERGMLIDAPPTKADIDLVFTLLTGRGASDTAEMLDVLRTQKTIRDVFIWVIRQRSFRTGNRELLSLIADGSLQL